MNEITPENNDIKIKLSNKLKSSYPILKNLAPNLITELKIDGQLYLVLSVDDENKNIFTHECLYVNSLKCSIVGEMKIHKKRSIIVQPDIKKNSMNILTKRELQVVLLVAEGLVNKQIANRLNISEWTVSTHLRRIYAKLGVDSRASMIYYCSNIIKQFKKE